MPPRFPHQLAAQEKRLLELHEQSRNNVTIIRSKLNNNNARCCCFYCLKYFHPRQILHYTKDGSANCPNCGIDSVVLSSLLNEHTLMRMHLYWFEECEEIDMKTMLND